MEKSERIKSWRVRRQLSQREAADFLGVHPQMVSDWERGKKNPRPTVIRLIDLDIRLLELEEKYSALLEK